MSPLERRRSRLRLVWASSVATIVVATALAVPSHGGDGSAGQRTGDLRAQNEATKASRGLPHVDPPGTPAHDHSDPRTKNAVSRAGEVGKQTLDPTTSDERRRAASYVAAERRRADPQLTTVPATTPRTAVPRTRYAMAGGCYTLRSTASTYLTQRPDDLLMKKGPRSSAARIFFKATDLGRYLLYGGPELFLAGSDGVAMDAEPSTDAEWVVRKEGERFTFRLSDDRFLAVTPGGDLTLAAQPTAFALERAGSCVAYPESQIDIGGDPHAGVTAYQEVRGYVDAHTHGMAFEFLGGEAHCGRPWHEYGVEYALRDCPDHEATGGTSVLETALSGETSHDPVGWPRFADWPAPDSLTHEGTYYRWLERSWRGGERLFVNLLVENNKLCELYPLKRNSCDDMDSIRLQARDMYKLQDYIDAQFGGPGKGFYRIVRTPFEARRVINEGKMAVVMGIETSVPFGCTFKAVAGDDVPECNADDIDQQLDEMRALGVRQMELVNKFDNALAGVAGDEGQTGVAVNSANFLETGTFWDMKTCQPADTEAHDRNQVAFPEISPQQQDALFGAIGQVFGSALPAIPVYPPPNHCNSRGLSDLGKHTIEGLAERKMIFDPDHLSVKARKKAVRQVERLDYAGIVSSHSWSTPDAYPRIYRAGGFITPYAGDSTGFVDKWRRHIGWADPRYYWGIGFGADINGLGAQGDPRGADVDNAVSYPFQGLNGVTVRRQHAGERVYDINVDGVAQYGLYPDWIEDLRQVAGAEKASAGAAIVDDMTRGPEAYLQMWERAVGIQADSCRNPDLRKNAGVVRQRVRPGMSTTAVMRAVGQPFTRLGTTYGVCAKTQADPRVMVRIDFDRAGRVIRVR